MVGCMLVVAGSSFTIRLNLGFNYNTVNSDVLGVVIALVKFGLSRLDIMVLRIRRHLENTVL
jgi:hypothetical protein